MNVKELLTTAVEQDAADIFLVPGMPFSYKIGGRIIYQGQEKIMPEEMDRMITQIYELAKNRDMAKVREHGDDDFSFAIPGVSRFRANIFRQRGSLAGIIRVVRFELPDPEALHLPKMIIDVARMTKGMVLVTGPAGSGKSTTLACIIDEINRTRNAHVITLEDPIEYLHRHKMSVVTQREIVTDTDSYLTGYDGGGDGPSDPVHPAHHRRGQHHRPRDRRISARSAAADSHPALHGAGRSDLPAADSHPGRRRAACV